MHFPPFSVNVGCFGQNHTLLFREDEMMPVPVNHPEGAAALMRVWQLTGEPAECGCAVTIRHWRNMLHTKNGNLYSVDSSPGWLQAKISRNLQITVEGAQHLEHRLRAQLSLRALRKGMAFRGPDPEAIRLARAQRADKMRRDRWRTTVARWQRHVGDVNVIMTDELGASSYIVETRNRPDGGLRLTINLQQWSRFTRTQLALTEDGQELVVRHVGLQTISSDTFASNYLVIGRPYPGGFKLGLRPLLCTSTRVDGAFKLDTPWGEYTAVSPVNTRNLEKKYA